MLYTIVGMLVIILDQLMKFWVDRNINWTNPTRPVLPGILSLVRVQNDGAAFSFLSGSGARVWFIVLTGIFALLVVLALATNFISGRFGRWCLVLVTAGGLANMIDRIRYGFVIDMFKMELFDFAVFNVADIFITVFSIAFILYILFGGEKVREPDADEFDDYDREEDDRPARESVKIPRKAKSARAVSYDDEEDEEEDEEEEEEEEEDLPRRRKAKKAKAAVSARRKETDDELDDEYEDTPKRKADRSAAAAAAAYKKRPAESARRSTRERPKEEPAKAGHDEENAFKEVARKRPSTETARKAPAARQQARPSRPAEAPARRPAPRPASDNPFAEWEEANAKAASNAQYNLYSEEPAEEPAPVKRTAAPAEQPAKPAVRSAKPAKPENDYSFSDDLDLDSILNEFK